MKTRLLSLVTLLILLAGLLPTTAALAGDDDGDFEFKGTIVSLPNTSGWIGDWTVNDGTSDRTVHVNADTSIQQEHGAPAAGVCVEVKGWLQSDNSVNATKVETKAAAECSGGGEGSEFEFHGTIGSLPDAAGWIGDWTVDGRTVHVDATTRIDEEHGVVAVGAYVEVKGWLQADGSVNATKIEVKSSPGGSGGEMEFYGSVETLPDTPGWIGDWIVSGVVVRVTASTAIEQEHGPVAVGAYVEVKGTWRGTDGSVDAAKIEVKMGAGAGGSGNYVKFHGTIDSLPATMGWVGKWTVDGRTVHVDATTRIEQEDGLVTLGAYVEVKGWSQTDDSVNATKIEVKASPDNGTQTKFYGTVQSLPVGGLLGVWVVSDVQVHVDATTHIEQEDGAVVVGAYVEVKGWSQPDGSVNAAEIEVKDSPEDGAVGSLVEFYGTIEQMPTDGFIGLWIISGRVTTVTATTVIDEEHGPAVVDAYVEVKGILQADGSIAATKIEVKSSPGTGGGNVGYIKFYGLVEDIIRPATDPNFIEDWLVSSRPVHISATTIIEQEHGAVGIGVFVEVKGIQQADGSVNATKIEVKDTRS